MKNDGKYNSYRINNSKFASVNLFQYVFKIKNLGKIIKV